MIVFLLSIPLLLVLLVLSPAAVLTKAAVLANANLTEEEQEINAMRYEFRVRILIHLVFLLFNFTITAFPFHVPFWLSYILVYLFYLCPSFCPS